MRKFLRFFLLSWAVGAGFFMGKIMVEFAWAFWLSLIVRPSLGGIPI